MTLTKLTAAQAAILSELTTELAKHPGKKGKKRIIPPELKARIGKEVGKLPEHISYTEVGRILGLPDSRVRNWTNGKGLCSVGGDHKAPVEMLKKKEYANVTTFGVPEYTAAHMSIVAALNAKPRDRAAHLAAAQKVLATALSAELNPG